MYIYIIYTITGESDRSLYVGLKIGCYIVDIKEHWNETNGKRKQVMCMCII